MKNEISEIEIADMVKCLQKIAGKSRHGWRIAVADRLGVSEGTVRNAEKGRWSAPFAEKVEAVMTATRDGADRDRLLSREAGSWAVGEPVDTLRGVAANVAGEAVVTRMTAPACVIYVKMTCGGAVEHRIRWIDDVQRDAEGVEGIVQKGIRLGIEHITARQQYEHAKEDRKVVELRSGYTDDDIRISTYQQLINGNLSMTAAQARSLRDRIYSELAALRSKRDKSAADHAQMGRLEMMREMAHAALRDDEMTGAARSVIATYAERAAIRRGTPRDAAAPHQHTLEIIDTLEQIERGERELPPPPVDALDRFVERSRTIFMSTSARTPDEMAQALFG